MHRSMKLFPIMFLVLMAMPVSLRSQEKPALPAAAPAVREIKLTPEEENAILLRWQDVEKSQLALQNVVLSIQINHGWSKDYYYDFQARKFMRTTLPPAQPEKK